MKGRLHLAVKIGGSWWVPFPTTNMPFKVCEFPCHVISLSIGLTFMISSEGMQECLFPSPHFMKVTLVFEAKCTFSSSY